MPELATGVYITTTEIVNAKRDRRYSKDSIEGFETLPVGTTLWVRVWADGSVDMLIGGLRNYDRARIYPNGKPIEKRDVPFASALAIATRSTAPEHIVWAAQEVAGMNPSRYGHGVLARLYQLHPEDVLEAIRQTGEDDE